MYPMTPKTCWTPSRLPNPDSTGRYYNQWYLSLNSSIPSGYWGGRGVINLWRSEVKPNDTNIAQLALSRGQPTQSIEAGKIETTLFNNGAPTFFVYFTTNGYVGGQPWTGGYINSTRLEFVQMSTNWFPGGAWQNTQLSQFGDVQRVIDVQIVHSDPGNAWWVWVNNEWVGYLIDCRSGNVEAYPCQANTPSTYSNNGLRPRADVVTFYGEVKDQDAPNSTRTDMGSGKPGSAGWQQAAYFRTMRAVPTPSQTAYSYLGTIPGNLLPIENDPGCYDMGSVIYGGSWVNGFYYGGMGSKDVGALGGVTLNPNCP